MTAACSFSCGSSGSIPVSYTHLDVYKRQTFLCYYLRRRYLERADLPYPIGQAAAETLQAGDTGGKKAALLFGSLGVSAIFTALRDYFKTIPELISGHIGLVPISLYTSPMAIAIGYRCV